MAFGITYYVKTMLKVVNERKILCRDEVSSANLTHGYMQIEHQLWYCVYSEEWPGAGRDVSL